MDDSFFIKPTNKQRKKENVAKSTCETNNKVKKPFDKKKWRLQKYSNKYKLQQWEEKRRKTILKKYRKDVRDDDGPKFDVQKIYETIEEDGGETSGGKIKKPTAHSEFERIQEEKREKRAQFSKKKAEREEALKQAKRRKAEKQKKLNRKTKKGQPIMRERLEMLLERIEKSLD